MSEALQADIKLLRKLQVRAIYLGGDTVTSMGARHFEHGRHHTIIRDGDAGFYIIHNHTGVVQWVAVGACGSVDYETLDRSTIEAWTPKPAEAAE